MVLALHLDLRRLDPQRVPVRDDIDPAVLRILGNARLVPEGAQQFRCELFEVLMGKSAVQGFQNEVPRMPVDA